MHNELTNLLPPERRRMLTRNYFLRLSVVIVAMVTMLVLISALLLLPTYVLLTDSIRAKEARLMTIESSLSSADEIILSARLAILNDNVSMLSTLAKVPSTSATIRSVLALARPGLSLTRFEYAPRAEKIPGTLTIAGIAATRDALRRYQLALESSALVRSASLPVSAYAKESAIPFSIAVTLAP